MAGFRSSHFPNFLAEHNSFMELGWRVGTRVQALKLGRSATWIRPPGPKTEARKIFKRISLGSWPRLKWRATTFCEIKAAHTSCARHRKLGLLSEEFVHARVPGSGPSPADPGKLSPAYSAQAGACASR